MILTEFKFFVFLFSALLAYYVLPKKFSYITLFICSIYFLFFNNFSWLNLLFVSLILGISYGGGLLIDKFKTNKDDKKAKIFFILSIILILGVVTYLKYTNMFINIINLFMSNKIANIDTNPPLGLSYFSLVMIGYLIDSYWGISKAQKNPVKLGLFMTYFPILTSGPFMKYSDQEKELFDRKPFDMSRFLNGLIRMLWGAFKILVISGRIGMYVDGVYADIGTYSWALVILACILYVFQLYSNFSGTIDIVLGVSSLFGIELPENFDRPLFSETITDFWRRWHITLGAWLKNYIFYPLMKSKGIQKLNRKLKESKNTKVRRIPTYICLFVVWLLIGLWHGGKLTFVIGSGLLQFLFILVEDLYDSDKQQNDKYFKFFRVVRTFILFALAMVFFRATSIDYALDIFAGMFKDGSYDLFSTGLSLVNGIILVISLVFMMIFDYYLSNIREFFNRTSNVIRLGFVLGLILIVLLLGVYGVGFNVTDFIYSKF